MVSETAVDGCMPCHLEDAPDDAVVFRDDTWACEIGPGSEVPGWYILRLRRHAEGWEGLTPTELAGFGDRSQHLSTAIRAALGVSHVYFMSFGENHAHFHFLVTARGAEIPPDMRGANIMKLRDTHRDQAAAIALVPALRAALNRTEPQHRTPELNPSHQPF